MVLGWVLKEIICLEVNINKYKSIASSSYIKLPNPIEDKKAIINVQNFDNACFFWAIVSAICRPNGDPRRISSYQHYERVLHTQGIEIPVKLNDINKFERQNPIISVNVFMLELNYNDEKESYKIIGPVYHTKQRKENHVNLLIINNEEGGSHYTWIKNLSRLISTQVSKHSGVKYFCDSCLNYFYNKSKLERHQKFDCNHVVSKLPTKNLKIDKFGKSVPENILKFENFEKSMKMSFVAYCDLETILKPIDSCEPKPDSSFTIKKFEHEAYSFAYHVKCSFNDQNSFQRFYRGPNVGLEFIKTIEKDVKYLYETYYKYPKPMSPLTDEEKSDFEKSNICHICDKIIEPSEVKVHDHDHLTSKYLGPAHGICNVNYKVPKTLCVFFPQHESL